MKDDDRTTKNNLSKTFARRAFLLAGFAVLACLVTGNKANAQRRLPPRIRRRIFRRRGIRRRAIRRLRQRGRGLEDQARQAVRRGKIRPLRDVMAKVRRHSNAEVIDVDLRKRPGGWVYALRILTKRGRVRDVFLDARTLNILSIEQSHINRKGLP